MGLLMIVAIPIFIGLANKAVHENAEANTIANRKIGLHWVSSG
jgi:hypothetical protein